MAFTTLGVVVTCPPLVLLDGCKSVLFSAIGTSVMKIEVEATVALSKNMIDHSTILY